MQNLTERLYILENDDAIDHKPSLIMKSTTLVLRIYNDYKIIYMRWVQVTSCVTLIKLHIF